MVELTSAKMAAGRLRVSDRTIRRWAKNGALAATFGPTGRLLGISAAAVERRRKAMREDLVDQSDAAGF